MQLDIALLNRLSNLANSFGVKAEVFEGDANTSMCVSAKSSNFTLMVGFDFDGQASFLRSSENTSRTYANLLLKWREEIDNYNIIHAKIKQWVNSLA